MKLTAVAATALSCVLTLGGCALTEPAKEKPSKSPRNQRPRRQRLSRRTSPHWFDKQGEQVFPEQNVYDGLVMRDRVITMTLAEVMARSLPDLDTAYAVRPPSGGNFVDLFERGGSVIVLETFSTPDEGTTAGDQMMAVRRFSAETGNIDAEVEVKRRKVSDESARPTLTIAGVAGDVVVVQSKVPDSMLPPTLTAVDLAKGKQLWTSEGSRFLTADNEQVITHAATAGGEVVSLDAQSGKPLWRALAGNTTIQPVGG